MAFAIACGQKDGEIDEKEAEKIFHKKLNKANEELVKLQHSYDMAIDDIQKHFSNASAVLAAIKEEALESLDGCMLEYKRRLREKIQDLKKLKQNLSDSEIHVETVPRIRFLGNEAFLFQVLNRRYLPYFGSMAMDSKLLASDLHLYGSGESYGQCYTFRIDVHSQALEIDDLKSRIKCEVFEKESGESLCLTPDWIADHFEIKFGFPKKTSFSLGVFLLQQHVTGSPVNVNLENDTLQTDHSDIKNMEGVETSSKRSLLMLHPVIEGTLQEVNSNMNTIDGSNKTPASEVDFMVSGRTLKISKKSKPPNSSVPCYSSQAPWRKSGDEDMSVENLKINCPENDVSVLTKNTFEQENFGGEIMDEKHGCGNLMIKTMSFNGVEAKLLSTIHMESPYALNRPVGILEHSSGDIIVSDTFNDRVLRLNSEGVPISLAGPCMGFRRPSSLVELHDGSFAVICSRSIAVFDADGNHRRILGENLLERPYGLTLSEDGKLLTVETAYHGFLILITICPELKMELSRVRVPLQLTDLQKTLSKPRFMASYKDKVYVGDLGLDCVYEICYTSGCLLNIFGSKGSEPGCLKDPSGIVCDPCGNIFVADSRNHRIQVYDSCRRFICIIEVDYPLNRPSGICLARSDHLFVLNYWENNVAKYHLTYKST